MRAKVGDFVMVKTENEDRVGRVVNLAEGFRRVEVRVCWQGHPVHWIKSELNLTPASAIDRLADTLLWGVHA